MVGTTPCRSPLVVAHRRSRRFLVTVGALLVIFVGPVAVGMAISTPARAAQARVTGPLGAPTITRSGWYPDQTN